MTDRDHFAAAALTGLVGECGYHSPEDVAGEAYALADAMLRERERSYSRPTIDGIPVPLERTNHDAAPAARAQLPTGDHASGGSGSVGTDNADPLTRWGTGDTQEPVAWGVATSRGVIATSISRIDAVDMQSDYACDTEVVPLYRSPMLTATPPSHATSQECSVPPECTQPVAWWVTLVGRVASWFE